MWRIVLDDLQGQPIRGLLEEHLADMRAWSPPESVHALDLDRLRGSDIRFWTLWEGEQLLGCGAIKTLDAQHGEIKSMRTARSYQGKGVGRAMLSHLLVQAKDSGLLRLSLETGAQPQFAAARALYASEGFEECSAFGDYLPDPNSIFMTKVL